MSNELPVPVKIKMISDTYKRVLNAHMLSRELTTSQSHIIGFLYRNGGGAVCQHDIEEELGIKHPTVTGLLKRMQAKGFVEFAEGSDKRCKTVRLTQKSLDIFEDAHRLIIQTDAELFGSLPEDKRRELSEILDTVIENAKQSKLLPGRGGKKIC